ncbi:MAG: phosphate ABC transporter substrate-binding protein PstS [Anaerolineae bacterium]|nr:phosphate ABC transporter substrate-binding protein PstS [Anaerolineae bacterium]MCA9910640.1 phosphate ABC transporter substrate-binding protein PstS [Anaerolineae bacterium]
MKVRALLTGIAILSVLILGTSLVAAQDMSEVPGSGLVNGPMAGEAQSLTGAGATFPLPLYTAWFADYATLTGVQVNYQGIGSGGGIRSITDQTVNFGASDGPMTEDQLAAARETCGADILHIPTALGGVVPIYNVPEVQDAGEPLKFTPDTLSKIFLGEITNWNDETLVADNPELADVDQPIAVVHRADGSGTTNIWTSYLSAVSETWASEVGAGTSVDWPTGIGQRGNAGIAGAVAGVPYSIGYVELAYAEQNDLPVSQVQNSAGTFVQANTDSVSLAAAGVELPDDLRIMIVNGSGDDTYPIAGFTWLLVCPNQTDPAIATALTRVIWWGIHDGQSYHSELGYAPLPEAAVLAGEQQLLKVMVNGAPALPSDLVEYANSDHGM